MMVDGLHVPPLKEATPVSEKIIVWVTDREDSSHGEISVVDDARTAEKLVETLLEAGFDRERIQIFVGSPSEFQVSQRPVVALTSEGGAAAPPPPAPAREPTPAVDNAVNVEEAAGPVDEAAAAGETAEAPGAEAEEEAEPATPVRFSSLFRSA